MKKDLVKLIKKSSVDILYLGLASFCALLCDMEFCSKRVGRSKDKRLYLYGSGDNGHYFCTNFT